MLLHYFYSITRIYAESSYSAAKV